jgi:hypothetical protein
VSKNSEPVDFIGDPGVRCRTVPTGNFSALTIQRTLSAEKNCAVNSFVYIMLVLYGRYYFLQKVLI